MSAHGGPDEVTSGLVLALDAADIKSYPRTGTVWYDRSGNGNNGTMVGGMSAVGNAMVFDGTNDYVDCGSGSTLNMSTGNAFTISCWFYATSNGTNTTLEIFHKRNNVSGPTYVSYGLSWSRKTGENFDTLFCRIGFTDGSVSDLFSTVLNQNQWYFGTQTFDGVFNSLYINGILNTRSTSLSGKTIKDDNLPVTLGSWNGSAEFFKGNISAGTIYNRALSPQEILQNYNANKSRFGL